MLLTSFAIALLMLSTTANEDDLTADSEGDAIIARNRSHQNEQKSLSDSEKPDGSSGSVSCWSEVPGRKKGSNGWWMGVCEDALDYCGGTAVMIGKEVAGEEPPVGIEFSRYGVNGYPAEKVRCTDFNDEEEDLDSAVAEVFERLPLPVPVVVSEPEVLSLVNLENYVRGVVDDFDTTVELLDQQVRITAYPTVWSWDMGDGTTYERTAGAGGFPDGGVLHPFYRVGEYDMSVTVTWEGHYQVEDSNTWLPVNGQGYTTSEPEHLAVEERRAYLGTPDDPDD